MTASIAGKQRRFGGKLDWIALTQSGPQGKRVANLTANKSDTTAAAGPPV